MTIDIQGWFPDAPGKCPIESWQDGIKARILVFSERISPGPLLRAGVKPPIAGLLLFGCSLHPASEPVSVTSSCLKILRLSRSYRCSRGTH